MGKFNANSKGKQNLGRKKATEKSGKKFITQNKSPSGRYFNSALGAPIKNVKKGKDAGSGNFRRDKKGTGSPKNSFPPATVRPKPKRLKKGPGKINQKNDPPNPNGQKKFGNNNNRASSSPANENQNLVQTPETQERIKKIKQNEIKPRQKMIVKPEGKWYETEDIKSEPGEASINNQESELIKDIKTEIGRLSKEEIGRIRKIATDLFENDCLLYRKSCMNGDQKSDFQWMERMMKIGTLPDRMAAYVVRIQDSPVHNIQHLQNLISMVKTQSKQQCLAAADAVKDLFLEDLLPPDRKLQFFDKRGSSLSIATRIQLVKWVYEDRLKTCYKSFIDAVRKMSLDNVDEIRAKAIILIYRLLTAHPELEAELLQMLVNKLGDPVKKLGSRALFYLNSLLRTHPRMKAVVIDEVERLLFRNNIAKRAQYYGICFLNSIYLENEHPEIACKLINVYVAFFKGCVKTGDIESKMMSALLTGVNTSYPLAKEYGFKFAENINTLYKITHLSNFNICIQALSILFQLTDLGTTPQEKEADRYYRVLYQELLRPEFATTSHNLQFLNLIFKSMKRDTKINRVKGFCKRLLQICQSVQPNLACGILFLLSEVSKVHPDIINAGPYDNDTVMEEEISEDEEEEMDSNDTSNLTDLMKISNVQVDKPSMETKSPTKNEDLESQHEIDTKVNDDDVDARALNETGISIADTSGAIFEGQEVKSEYRNKLDDYDPFARNPCFCGAEFSVSHEIFTLMNHFHPSVALFAKELSRRKHIVYDGNPVKDFTTARFLERFVYKNAKKSKKAQVGIKHYQPKGLRAVPVNSADYLKHEEEAVPVEEQFFYRFFKSKKEQKRNVKDEDFETDSIGDDEFDEIMANYFKSSKRKGTDEDDDDLEDDLDFAADMHSKPKSKKRKGAEEEEEDDDGDLDDEDADDDDGDDFGPDDDADELLDLDDDDEDFHEEDGLEVFEESDFDVPKKKKKGKRDFDMFAPAEQFAEMLESNADFGLQGPSTLINKDNADPKQLQWEMDRERWVKGFKGSSKSRFKNKRRNKSK